MTILLGKPPLPRLFWIIGTLILSAVVLSLILVGTGVAPTESLTRAGHDGRSHFVQAGVWLVGIAVSFSLYLLTRRAYEVRIEEGYATVRQDGQTVWEGDCAGWRWRRSDPRYVVGVELLDADGKPFLIQPARISTGQPTPFLPLTRSLTQAGIPEKDTLVQPLPFRQDVGAWASIGLLVVMTSGLIWLLASSISR